MKRRNVLAMGAAVVSGGVAGCLGSDGDGDGNGDGGEYETISVEGQSVPLVPTSDAFEWFDAGEVEFVDARSRAEYDNVHVAGAVFSPAPDGLETDDPVATWETDTRIVTYCVCPHSLAGRRAASLLADGYTDVYALDEGLREWVDRGHPVAGDGAETRLPTYEVRGRSDPAFAGENVWVREPATGQRELGAVDTDGTYELALHFVDVTDDTRLELEAPDYELEATLAELTDGVVTGPRDR